MNENWGFAAGNVQPPISRCPLFLVPRLLMAPTRKTVAKSKKYPDATAAQNKWVAVANYYQKNAEVIREKRRIQMAEKRAAKKKKRQESRKPRVKKPPAVHRDDNSTNGGSSLTMTDLALAEAEREASETLTGMCRRATQEGVKIANDPDLFQNWTWDIPHIDMEGSSETGESDDERQMGVRSLSEVAGDSDAELSTGAEQEQDRIAGGDSDATPEANKRLRCAIAPDHPEACASDDRDSDDCDELQSDHMHTDGEDAGTAEERVAANMGLQSRGVAGDAVFRFHDDPTTHPKELRNLGHASRMQFPITPSSSPTPILEPQSRMPSFLDYLDTYMQRRR
ncbi:hypothetical protein B0H14DRAFT_927392 [Mycena olivaceomarginata]|nr:hypothetical protein B0H14DRAFT_927392 [Mycena olivaceomarginata]